MHKAPGSDHFWKLRCRKSARRCGAKHISKSKVQKTEGFGTLLDVQMSFCVAGARDCAPSQKWAKREGFVCFVAFLKTMASVGHLKRVCQDAFSVAGAVQETCSSEMLGGEGADFLKGCILEHQICRFAKMILRGQVHRFVWPGINFSWQAQYCRQVEWKIAKPIGTRQPTLHSTFHFWRTSHRIASFLVLSSSKIEEVSQNCFVLDVVQFKNWGSVAK